MHCNEFLIIHSIYLALGPWIDLSMIGTNPGLGTWLMDLGLLLAMAQGINDPCVFFESPRQKWTSPQIKELTLWDILMRCDAPPSHQDSAVSIVSTCLRLSSHYQ